MKVVLKQGPARGSFGREALQVFEGGVRTALRKMARRGIPVMVKTPQGPVVGVPANRNGVFVIEGEVTRTKRRGSTAKR